MCKCTVQKQKKSLTDDPNEYLTKRIYSSPKSMKIGSHKTSNNISWSHTPNLLGSPLLSISFQNVSHFLPFKEAILYETLQRNSNLMYIKLGEIELQKAFHFIKRCCHCDTKESCFWMSKNAQKPDEIPKRFSLQNVLKRMVFLR